MKKGVKIIVIIVMILLAILTVGLLVWEYIEKGRIESSSVYKAAAVLVSIVISVVRINLRDNEARALGYKKHEEMYSDYIKNAFVRPEQKKQRRELLRAIDNYNQNNYPKALDILDKLKKDCQKSSDIFGVNMFKALCYSDMGLTSKAIEAYESIVSVNISNSTVFSNLGLLYIKEGKNREAEECYLKSIECNGNNPYPYNNLGILYLKESRYDDAIKYALWALDKKNNMYQASNTLAIAYTVLGKFDLADKYFKISVANGVDANTLRNTIDRFCEELD